MENGERKSVYKVYDKIASWFSEHRNTRLIEKNYLDDLIDRFPANGSVLDLGCGTGKPMLEYLLNKNLNVTGVDGSSKMVEIARSNFPSTEILVQDMRSLALDKKFDAIIAWHSLFHLPAEDQPRMFEIFEQHLNPDGILLFTSGTEHGETWAINGGENLFMASLSTSEYERLLKQHHFRILEYVENDRNCGHANVWTAQYSPSVY